MWIILTLFSVLALSVSQLLDKFLIDKKIPAPSAMTFWITSGGLAGTALVFWNFNFGAPLRTIAIALASGVCYVIGLQFYYHGLKKGEASHLVPLVGGISPLVIAFVSYFALNEDLRWIQYLGIIIASFGTLLIGFENPKGKYIFSKGSALCLISAVFFSLSWVFAKAGYDTDTFSTVFVWARIGAFGAVLPLLFSKGLRQSLFKRKAEKRRGNYLPVLALNMFLSIIYYIGIQLAVNMASASVVAGFATLQYAIFVVLIYSVSKRYPQIIKERYFSGEFGLEIGAIALIVAGTVLLAIS
jgi:drug/metabolite transporter (DMT)-like permease